MHGLHKITEDGTSEYFHSEYGIKVVRWSGEWIGYYRIDRWCKMVLTGFCYGIPPGELTTSIRAYEDMQRFYGIPHSDTVR